MRKEIEDGDVPLPQKWDNFIIHADNKADGKTFVPAVGSKGHQQTRPSSSLEDSMTKGLSLLVLMSTLG